MLRRNMRPFWYCLYQGASTITDSDGYDTGEPSVTYASPVKVMGFVSAASGDAEMEQFGVGVTYDKVITLSGTDWPIDEKTLLFIDTEPPKDFNPSNVVADYAVVRVSVSVTQTTIAVRRLRNG
jgi:hypothetical protein